ncbi:MAG: hypothetical protein ACWGQW_23820, partial [bacterium]
LIFAAVNMANFRLYKATTSSRWISALGAVACSAAFIALIGYTFQHSPTKLWFLVVMLLLAILTEAAYRTGARRDIRRRPESPPEQRATSVRGEDSGDRSNLRISLGDHFGLDGEKP